MDVLHALALTLAAVAVAVVVISFLEHTAHWLLLHRSGLARRFGRRLPVLNALFREHAVKHHGRWYRVFDHEPDPVGRWHNIAASWGSTLSGLVLVTPPTLVVIYIVPAFGLPLAVSFVAGAIAHNRAWNALHTWMHLPECRPGWLYRRPCWAVFRFMARHHYLHHEQPNRNLNLVVPLADYLLGTVADPQRWRPAHRERVQRELRRMGFEGDDR